MWDRSRVFPVSHEPFVMWLVASVVFSFTFSGSVDRGDVRAFVVIFVGSEYTLLYQRSRGSHGSDVNSIPNM